MFGHFTYREKLSFIHLICLDISYTWQNCHFFHYAWTAHIQSKNVIYPLYLATSYTKENVIYPLCLDTSYTEQKCHLSFMLGHLIYRAKMSFIHYAWTPHTHCKNVNYDSLRLDTSYTEQRCHLSIMLGHLLYIAKLSFIYYAWTPHIHSKIVIYPLCLDTSYTEQHVNYPLCLDISYTGQCHESMLSVVLSLLGYSIFGTMSPFPNARICHISSWEHTRFNKSGKKNHTHILFFVLLVHYFKAE